ncbi:MAG: LytTR family transcriptional regulator [Saprospiraceae bacterium]|nr:LytTR family transcriptional regulator [Saprospiraceae bacterium]
MHSANPNPTVIDEQSLQTIDNACSEMDIKEFEAVQILHASFFYIRESNYYYKIMLEHILYFKAVENYTQIVTTERTYTVLIRLIVFEKQLPPSVFMRANRSYIVNKTKISAINKTEIIIDNHQIALTRTYWEAIFNDFINQHLIRKEP